MFSYTEEQQASRFLSVSFVLKFCSELYQILLPSNVKCMYWYSHKIKPWSEPALHLNSSLIQATSDE